MTMAGRRHGWDVSGVGTVYSGPYADEIGYDKHEGYAVALDAAGADAGPETWLAYEDEADHLAAACACGWRGGPGTASKRWLMSAARRAPGALGAAWCLSGCSGGPSNTVGPSPCSDAERHREPVNRRKSKARVRRRVQLTARCGASNDEA